MRPIWQCSEGDGDIGQVLFQGAMVAIQATGCQEPQREPSRAEEARVALKRTRHKSMVQSDPWFNLTPGVGERNRVCRSPGLSHVLSAAEGLG